MLQIGRHAVLSILNNSLQSAILYVLCRFLLLQEKLIIDRYCLDAMGERLLLFIYFVISMSLFPYVHAGKLITSFAYPNICYLVAIGMFDQCTL